MGTARDIAGIFRQHWSLFLGNLVEWYDFALYGYLERFLEDKFFHGSAVGAWLGFGVTFFARPIGGAAFGALADRLGRKMAVNLTIVGMLLGTCGQGCLPTYDDGKAAGHIGLVLLVALRLLQGMSAGGEIVTVVTYVAESGRVESLGRAMALIPITGVSGFLLAKSAAYLTEEGLGEDAMRDWGWRLPFLIAFVPGAVAVWGRRFMPESKAFVQHQATMAAIAAEQQEPHGEAAEAPASAMPQPSAWQSVMSNKISIALAIAGVSAHGVLLYSGFVWTNTYVVKRGMSPAGAMAASLCGRMLTIIFAIPTGWLIDRQGVAWVLLAASAAQAALGLPLFAAIEANPTSLAVVLPIAGLAYGALYVAGTSFFLFVVELFPVAVRGTVMGVGYNVGLCISGGLAPAATESLLALTPLAPGVFMSLSGLVTCGAVLGALAADRRGAAVVAHVRPYPYFGALRLRGPSKERGASKTSSEGESCVTSSSSSNEDSGAEAEVAVVA